MQNLNMLYWFLGMALPLPITIENAFHINKNSLDFNLSIGSSAEYNTWLVGTQTRENIVEN